MAIVLFVGIMLAVFMLALLTKRRYGAIGLGLAAGAYVAQSLGGWLGIALADQGIATESIGQTGLAAVTLILAPIALLALGGPSYKRRSSAIVGGAIAALLAGLLVIEPLTIGSLSLDSSMRDVLIFVASYEQWLIAAAVSLALFDVVFTRTAKPSHKKDKH